MQDMKRITIVLVIYNTKINESLSYEYFHKNICDEDKLCIFDNSVDTSCQLFNSSYSYNKNELYLSSGRNEGLSKAYNTVIQNIEKDSDNWIIISDQDTSYPENYISVVKNNINNTNAYVLCPIINDKLGILSPCKSSWRGFSHIFDIDTNRLDKYSYINSGMVINSTVFSNIKYDENLFLDFIDHDFILQLKQNELAKIQLLENIKLFQNFSGAQINTKEQDFLRFQLFVTDGKYYYKKWNKKNPFKSYLLYKRCLKLIINYKDLAPIRFLIGRSKLK